MFLKKYVKAYDNNKETPAIRSSICTGEKVAGFIDNATGKFRDIMLIKNEKDLNCFLKNYNVKKEDLKSYF